MPILIEPLSSAVWESRSRCQRLRRNTRAWNDGFKQFSLYHSLLRWRFGAACFRLEVRRNFLLRELFAAALRFATAWAKKQIARDKNAFLQSARDQLEGKTFPEVQRLLKRLGLSNLHPHCATLAVDFLSLGRRRWMGRGWTSSAPWRGEKSFV